MFKRWLPYYLICCNRYFRMLPQLALYSDVLLFVTFSSLSLSHTHKPFNLSCIVGWLRTWTRELDCWVQNPAVTCCDFGRCLNSLYFKFLICKLELLWYYFTEWFWGLGELVYVSTQNSSWYRVVTECYYMLWHIICYGISCLQTIVPIYLLFLSNLENCCL